MANIVAIIVAAGSGERMIKHESSTSTPNLPKQYMPINGTAMLTHSIMPFIKSSKITKILCVINKDHDTFFNQNKPQSSKILTPVHGGKTRQESVKNALNSLKQSDTIPDLILIHDAARPMIKPDEIEAVIAALENGVAKGATLAHKVADSFRRGEMKNSNILAKEFIPRDDLYALQTPQGFDFKTLLKAHNETQKQDHTDDTSLLSEFGFDIILVPGAKTNIKVTTPDDMELASKLLS